MGQASGILVVLVGGAVGGWISVLDSWADPVSYPLTFAKVALLFLIPLVKGAAAAGIGVYLLTTLDPKQLARGFFFALTCGLAFPSILSNGKSYSEKVTAQVATKVVADNTARLKDAKSVEDIRAASVAILNATPKTDSPGMGEAAVQHAVTELGTNTDPARSAENIDALSEIGTLALTQNASVAGTAVEQLRALTAHPDVTPADQGRARDAATRIERDLGARFGAAAAIR